MDLLTGYSKENVMDVLSVLKDIAEALSAVLGSSDDELLNAPDVRAGFCHIASAMGTSLGGVSDLVWKDIQKARALETERDQARAAAHEAEVRFMNLKAAVEYNDAERAREEAAAQVPDLTEPVPIPASSIAAAG